MTDVESTCSVASKVTALFKDWPSVVPNTRHLKHNIIDLAQASTTVNFVHVQSSFFC